MTEVVTTSVSTASIITIPAVLSIDLSSGINMQQLYDDFIAANTSTAYTILGIDIPIIGIDCLQYKTIDPTFDIKEALSRLYNYLSKLILQPIITALRKLAEAIGAVIGDFLKIPILDLTIEDFFSDDFYSIVERKVTALWENSKAELLRLLEELGIPWPWFDQIDDPELSLRKIIKDIATSIWGFVWKAVGKIIAAIKIALRAYDIATFGFPKFSELWQEVVDAVLGQILSFFTIPPTIEELYKALEDFAKELFNLPFVTWEQLMEAIKKFKLPIFGSPLDWKLPLNIKFDFPEKDFSKVISDILIWISNFFVNLMKKFIEAVLSILEAFGIQLKFLTSINIPISVCAVENPKNT